MGDRPTHEALAALPEVEEAHVVAGPASLLVKIRAGSPQQLQASLRRLFQVEGVTGTRTIVVLETFFDRPLDPHPPEPAGGVAGGVGGSDPPGR